MCGKIIIMKTSKTMNNVQVAQLLSAISAALQVKKANRFRITAYDRAASEIEHATSEVKDLWEDNKLRSLPGVGKKIAGYLDELFRTGKVNHFEKMVKNLPEAMFTLLNISGIGPKNAFRLSKELNLLGSPSKVINSLERAAKKGKILALEGFGEKSQAEILSAVREYKKNAGKKKRMPLIYADTVASEIIAYLKQSPACLKAVPLGSLRRRLATVGDIDIAVATLQPQLLIDHFSQYPRKDKLIEKGPNKASIILKSGRRIDLRVQRPEAYGSMAQYFIGSKVHNIRLRELALKKGYSLSEHGIKPVGKPQKRDQTRPRPDKAGKMKNHNIKSKIYEFRDEKSFYNFLGLEWVPPELREGRGEIEAAIRSAQGKQSGLPNLVELKDIKGDLHVHSSIALETSHDNGESSMEEMIIMAQNLGYQYLGFSEHNPSLSNHSEKDILKLIKEKKNAIDKFNYSSKKLTHNLKIFNGLEIDIRSDGSLALPDKAFKFLDFALVSVHANFNMSRKKMTDRILKALKHPKVKVLGHPTGRMIGLREGYELDWAKVFDYCLKNHKALEINAWPNRLDLPDTLVREAVKKSVKMVINTDSHHLDQMNLMKYGLDVARRGWAEKGDILNCMPCGKMSTWLIGSQ